ncbi:hypothetical protein ES703_98008 [subsurface metagenome]
MAERAIAIAAPTTTEVTRTVSMAAGAGITGLAEGMIVRIAPQMGAAAPVLTWGALIGVPTFGSPARRRCSGKTTASRGYRCSSKGSREGSRGGQVSHRVLEAANSKRVETICQSQMERR